MTKFTLSIIFLSFISLPATVAAQEQINSPAKLLVAFSFKNAPSKANLQPEPSAASSISKLEQEAFALINQQRKTFNAPPVIPNEKLHDLARNYAARLIRENFFAHIDPQGRNPEQRASEAGISQGVYENLAMQSRGFGQSDAQLIVNAMNSMMNEAPDKPNHRYNILVPKHACAGVGVALSKDKLILVEEFADTVPQ